MSSPPTPKFGTSAAKLHPEAGTSIPAPEVYEDHISESIGRRVIVMEYIEADALQYVWEDMADDEQEIISQTQKS